MFTLLALDVVMSSGFDYAYDSYGKGKAMTEDTFECAEKSNTLAFLPFLRTIIKIFPNSSLAKNLTDR